MQGMLRPFTPMGMSAMRVATAQCFESVGIAADPFDGHPGIVDAAGRMYLDITGFVRNRPTAGEAAGRHGDLRAAGHRSGGAGPGGSAVRARAGPALPAAHRDPGGGAAGARPDRRAGGRRGSGRRRARARAFRAAAGDATAEPAAARPDHRGRSAALRDGASRAPFLRRGMRQMLPPIYAAMFARQAAVGLLAGRRHRERGRRDAARDAAQRHHRDGPGPVAARLGAPASTAICCCTPRPPSSPRATSPASCPSSGSASSSAATGTGAPPRSTSVCRAGPRTRRRCSPRSPATCGSPIRSRPRTGASPGRRRRPRRRSTSWSRRARRTRPVRARCAGFLLRRSRALAGLRELPKFAWLYAFAEMRRQLLAAGAELAGRGLLERADDIMFLDLREALAAADGADLRELVAARRADYRAGDAAPQRPRAAALRRNRSRRRWRRPARPPTGRWSAWPPHRAPRPAGPG